MEQTLKVSSYDLNVITNSRVIQYITFFFSIHVLDLSPHPFRIYLRSANVKYANSGNLSEYVSVGIPVKDEGPLLAVHITFGVHRVSGKIWTTVICGRPVCRVLHLQDATFAGCYICTVQGATFAQCRVLH